MEEKFLKIPVPHRDIARAVCDAAKLGDARESGLANDAFIEVSGGVPVHKWGREIVGRLETLPENHPDRKDIDLEQMRKGIGYLEAGTVRITSENLGSGPVLREGAYSIEVTYSN